MDSVLGTGCIFLWGAWVWIQGSLLQSRHSTTWVTPLVHFVVVILELGSHELFA
jgi:hypothetical protein